MNDIRKKLEIPKEALESLNQFLLDEDNPLINDLLNLLDKYGGVENINKKAEESSKIENLLLQLEKKSPSYVKDIEWLISERDNKSFINVEEYRKKILGDKAGNISFKEDFAVTLELSACQYFPFFINIS